MLPLPNCFSMVETARSMALSRLSSRGAAAATGGAAGTDASLTSFTSFTSFASVLDSLLSVAFVFSPCRCQLATRAPRDTRCRKTYVEPASPGWPRRLS